MRFIIVLLLAFVIFHLCESCSLQEQINGFSNKILSNPFPSYTQSPYDNLTPQQSAIIDATLQDKSLVCSIKYNNNLKTQYSIASFPSEEESLRNGYIVTHKGPCGSCSTLLDLVAYLKQNLTAPVRKCGAFGVLSKEMSMNCLLDLGFTHPCAEIWYYNTVNTKKHCFNVCMEAWILDEPYVDKNGNLNSCMQCDEDYSGPVFKYYSGRTRRNSGIHSEIDRPSDQIYNIIHCYF